MAIPSEIVEQLKGTTPGPHAQLSAGIDGPMGETHFVAADGRLHVFTRESLIGGLERVKLDAGRPPKLEKGGFADRLHLVLEDGTTRELDVGSFDRDRVQAVLDASNQDAAAEAETPDAPMESPWAEPPSEFGDRTDQKGFGAGPGDDPLRDHGDYASPKDAGYAAERSESYTAERSRGYAAERSRGYGAEAPGGYSAGDGQGGSSSDAQDSGAVLYRSSSPGLAGCIMQLLLFGGGIAAFWFLHPVALLNGAELLELSPPEPDGAVWVVTKILALIAGAYVGGRLSKLVGRGARAQMVGGAVAFKDGHLIVIGPRGKWHKRFDLGKDLETECRWYTSGTDASSKRHFQVVIEFRQGGESARVNTGYFAQEMDLAVDNMAFTKLDKAPSTEGSVLLDANAFREVVKRIAETRRM